MIAEVLGDFAAATKDDELLLKKLLVTQCPKRADWRNVYYHVSDDLECIEYKAPGALDAYADRPKVPFAFFRELFDDKTHIPGYDGPHAALFFCGNLLSSDELIDGLVEMYGREDGRVHYNALVDYFGSDEPIDETAIGEWIADFEYELPMITPTVKVEVAEQKRIAPLNEIKFEESEPLSWTKDVERKFRAHPAIVQYKAYHDLKSYTKSAPIAKRLLREDPSLLELVDYFTQDSIDALVDAAQELEGGGTKQDFVKKMLKGDWSVQVAECVRDASIKF